MSYSPATDSVALTAHANYSLDTTRVNPSSFMLYDIAALQYLYGANTSVNSTDSKLTAVQKLDFTDSYKGMQTIWTPNGATLDASGTANKNIIDLRSGAFSSINYLGTGTAQVTSQLNAAGVTSSNVVNSLLKTYSASITAAYTGNNNLALAYGSKITLAKGGAADDYFYVSNYSSSLAGGAGIDTVYLTGSTKDWTASNNATLNAKGGIFSGTVVLKNKTTNAQITLNGIEKYAFYAAGTLMTKV
jgi:serralysin